MSELEQLNKFIVEKFPEFFTREPSYRYWTVGSFDFCYTTERIKHEGKDKYIAFIQRHIKSKKQIKRTKKVYFGRRKVAKARALTWMKAYKARREGMKNVV